MEDTTQVLDPTQVGISGLKGLKAVNMNTTPAMEELSPYAKRLAILAPLIEAEKMHSDLTGLKNYRNETIELTPFQRNIGTADVGQSHLDKGITTEAQVLDLQLTRGELQPWYELIGNATAKGAVLAATTFSDGIVGTIAGLGNLAKGAIEGDAKFSDFWNNPFSVAMQGINNWSETVLPNYYTKQEQNDPWYTNIFTANFIGDQVIKNLGFAVGAAYSGKLEAGAVSKIMGLNEARQAFKGAVTAAGESLTNPNEILGALKSGDAFIDGTLLTNDLAKSAKKLKYADPIMQISGAMTGALGEARIEAITNTKQWFDLHKKELDDYHSDLIDKETESLKKTHPDLFNITVDSQGNLTEVPTAQAQALIDQTVKSKFDYDGGIKKITEDRLKMGNIDYLLNLPLLTISDAWQFGKFYAGGYKTARRATNIIKNIAEDGTVEYAAKKVSKFATAGRILLKGIAEGPYEEMMQNVASLGPGDKYASELNDFYGAKIDPDAEAQTIGWMQAMGNAMVETYGSASGWEQGAIGGLTGLIGIPTFNNIKNRETGKMQSPISMAGGMREDIKEVHEENAQSDEIVHLLNARVQSPEFLNYYQGTIRHNNYQRLMDQAAETGDSYAFKNAEHSQLISDAVLFDKAGRILDLYDHIDAAASVTPDQVEKIKQLSVRKDGTSVYDGVKDEDILAKIKDKATETKKSVDDYSKIADDLRVLIGNDFHGDGLDELTWMMTKIGDWEDRFKSVHKELKDALTPVLDALEPTTYINKDGEEMPLQDILRMSPVALLQEFVGENAPLRDLINGVIDKNSTAKGTELKSVALLISKALSEQYASEQKNRKGRAQRAEQKLAALSAKIEELSKKGSIVNGQKMLEQVGDLARLASTRIDFINKYDGYIKNPAGLEAKIAQLNEKVVTEKATKDNKALKDQLLASTNLTEFRDALSKEQDPAKKAVIVDELEKEGNVLAKTHKETSSYRSLVIKNIHALNESPLVKADAANLFANNYNNSDNLELAANPNSVHFDDTEVTHDDTLDENANLIKHLNAQWALMQAMHKANTDAKFKDRFSGELLDLTDKRSEATKAAAPVVVVPPVGDISPEQMNQDNSVLNNSTPSPTTFTGQQGTDGLKQYYHPTIPELHIEASKKGDYRSFPEVTSEREPDKDYSGIYNYLRDSGAFDYVNQGKLKLGDDVHFMIDPSFTEFGPDITTIFMVKNLSNGEHLVLGSLNADSKVVSRYEGLLELRDKIIAEYKASESKERFIASPVTKVSLIMTGKIAFTNTETSLKDVEGITGHEGETLFGIVQNGVLSTNGKVNDSDIVKPGNMANKEGRLYLLVKDPSGKYRPVAVRVQHFTKELFPNLNDAELQKNPMFARLKEVFEQYGKVHDEESEKLAGQELAKRLYTGNIYIKFENGPTGDYLKLEKFFKDENGHFIEEPNKEGKLERKRVRINVPLMTRPDSNIVATIGAEQAVSATMTRRNSQEIEEDIKKAIYSFDLPFQVNLQLLNNASNNTFLINSNILSANMNSTKFLGSWFTTQAFDSEGNLLNKTVIPNKKVVTTTQSPTGGTEQVIKGTLVTTKAGTIYIVTPTAILDKNGTKMNIADTFAKQIRAMAYIQANFGDNMNSSTMIEGRILLPDGSGFNRNTETFLNASEIRSLESVLKGLNKPTIKVTTSTPISIPIFNKDLENKNPVDNTSEAYQLADSKIGYVLKEGILTKTFIAPVGMIAGIGVDMIKTPNFAPNSTEVVSNNFSAVFSNGTTVQILSDANTSYSEELAGQEILKALSKNMPRLKDLSGLNTAITEAQLVNTENSETSDKSLNNSQSNPADLANKAANDLKPKNTRPKTLREVDDLNRPIWNQQEELTWLQRVLPQLSQGDLVKIQKGLIKVAQSGALAWGSFGDGVMTLSDIAAKGTVYHEAFHAVFLNMLSQEERELLYTEAKALYGDLDINDLEEKMAEGFREYMMSKETKGLGQRIINFFKQLFTKVTHWNALKPSLTSYYYNINLGTYSTLEMQVNSLLNARKEGTLLEKSNTLLTFDSLSSEDADYLSKKGWDKETFDKVSQEEKEHALRCATL